MVSLSEDPCFKQELEFTMHQTTANLDPNELDKFNKLAHRWWDPNSEFRPLHEINPLRLAWIEKQVALKGCRVLDVGCGGGILTEAMAKCGASVTGIDLGETSLKVARLHSLESGVAVEYHQIATEEFAVAHAGDFDVVTCMEMLEHVPDPEAIVAACVRLTKPGGHIFMSTLNRNPKSFLFAILGAEYVLKLLPKGTHDYAKFIKPSELELWLRQNGAQIRQMTGLTYNPMNRAYSLTPNTSVNYLLSAQTEAAESP